MIRGLGRPSNSCRASAKCKLKTLKAVSPCQNFRSTGAFMFLLITSDNNEEMYMSFLFRFLHFFSSCDDRQHGLSGYNAVYLYDIVMGIGIQGL